MDKREYMQRILIVEDDKALAQLIAIKLQKTFNMEVDIAYKLSEARLFLHKYKYFVTLLALKLSDAPNAEIVKYVLSKGQRAIILSDNSTKELRKSIVNKDIVATINKSDTNAIHNIINSIKRVQKNQNHKILVVDDSMVARKEMSSFLENLLFDVYTVAHGEEALGMLQTHPDISLMITNYKMPVMNGVELVERVRESQSKNDLCIIALSSNSDEEIESLFFKLGVDDYLSKPYSKEVLSSRIYNTLERIEYIHSLTNHANRDLLTGLYNRKYFFKAMKEYMNSTQHLSEVFVVAIINIDFLKNINETYTQEIGDRAIVHLSNIIRTSTTPNDLVSHFGGDEFTIVIKNSSKNSALTLLEKIRKEVEFSPLYNDENEPIEFKVSIGATLHQEGTLEDSISQADMMLYNAKHNGRNQVVIE